MASFGLVVFLFIDLWFGSSYQKVHEPLMRMLLATSGKVDSLVTGEQSGMTGDELDKLAKAISEPPSYALPFPTVWEYFAAMWQWKPDGEPSIPDAAFTSVNISDIESILPDNYNSEAVNESLQGVWCGPNHPSELACFVPFASNTSAGTNRLPAQGFFPGYMFMWDSPGARNTLEFMSRYNLVFEFPKWYDGVDIGQGSSIWTLGKRPFDLVPYPAAVYEGLPTGHLYRMRKITGNLFWDASASDDPAVCFCSVLMEAPNVIIRKNFGKEAYRVYRVLDEEGKKTSYWPLLTNWSAGRKIVKLNVPLHPHDTDAVCNGWCAWDVSLSVIGFYVPLLSLNIILILCCCCLPCYGCYSCYKKSVEVSDDEDEDGSPDDDDDEDGESSKPLNA